MARELNTREAELWVSLDGKEFRRAATVNTQGFAWGDTPVDVVEARYVQLRVTQGAADGQIRVASFDVFGQPRGE